MHRAEAAQQLMQRGAVAAAPGEADGGGGGGGKLAAAAALAEVVRAEVAGAAAADGVGVSRRPGRTPTWVQGRVQVVVVVMVAVGRRRGGAGVSGEETVGYGVWGWQGAGDCFGAQTGPTPTWVEAAVGAMLVGAAGELPALPAWERGTHARGGHQPDEGRAQPCGVPYGDTRQYVTRCPPAAKGSSAGCALVTRHPAWHADAALRLCGLLPASPPHLSRRDLGAPYHGTQRVWRAV